MLRNSSNNNYEWEPLIPLSRPRFRLDTSLFVLALTVFALAAMGAGYFVTLKPVALKLNQQSNTVLTNQNTVAGVLNDAGITLAPEDRVFPALNAPIPNNQPITIQFARPLQIQADGNTIVCRTQGKTIGEALRESGLFLKPGDQIFADGAQIESSMALPATRDGAPLKITIQRAIPIEINDNGAITTLYTTAPTLGEALRQAGLVVYLGDAVSPDLGTPVSPGYQVYIRRSREATIKVDSKTLRTRTRSNTIAGALADEGIELKDKDYSIPPATEPVREGATITIVRVREEFNTESEFIAFDTTYQADPTLDIDQRQTAQAGVEGVKKRTIRMVYENGREIKRSVEREWIDAAPVTQIINYGTRITKQTLTLPDGQVINYWRKVRILATSYTAATSGKARSHPEFGITYLGLQAGTGIVAVDPRVINLRSVMYIPGYGLGLAGDTGGRIKGKRVDLGYNESDLVLWYKWVDTYLVWPPPPTDQIHWIIPDTPKERTTR